MKNCSVLNSVNYNYIKPKGWLLEFLNTEFKGIVGNLDKIGYPYDTDCWAHRKNNTSGIESWWAFEQTAYWIDSVTRAAVFGDNEELKKKATDLLYSALPTDGDPFIGAFDLKEQSKRNRWPHAVLFRAFFAGYYLTGDKKFLDSMHEFYLSDMDFDYSDARNAVNIENMLNLYNITGDERLFCLAKKTFQNFSPANQKAHSVDKMLQKGPFRDHGVTVNEVMKIPAMMYCYSGNKTYLEASKNRFSELNRLYMLPDGVNVSQEFVDGNSYFMAHESCDIADYTWSVGYLMEICGEGKYGDKLERAVFNALPGAVNDDFSAIQYFSSPNQIVAARNSNHLKKWCNTTRMAYQAHHFPECCIGNIGRTMPNYIARMYQSFDGGIAVSLYGDSVYDDGNIKITQSGNYPFGDFVNLEISADREFMLKLRIPEWSKRFSVKLNGEILSETPVDGYIGLLVKNNDRLRLEFKKQFLSHTTADNGIYYTYGPILMSLLVEEKTETDKKEPRQTADFPAYNITPLSKWNYALKENETPKIINRPLSLKPFTKEFPFIIEIPAYTLKNWDLTRISQKDFLGNETYSAGEVDLKCGATLHNEDLVLTPNIPSKEFIKANIGDKTTVRLVPYGCTELRITVFPKCD